ncbi:MAG TPA: peptidoglycan editing factor PgeF [Xanthobacteraceae bacterium]|nr:peptidoglycan editing factor PgeF [Xanthobacteraceae bacterium]
MQQAGGMLQASQLSMLPRIRHGFFTRDGGVSDGFYDSLNGGLGSDDAPARVTENRARMAAALGVAPDRLVTAYQIHSPDVVVATQPWPRARAPRADAVVTRVGGLAVGVTTADCGPLLLADAEAGVVGAAHAGWRGALAGVIEAAVAAMERLGAARTRMVVALGPMIRQANYEVGPDFVARFAAADPDNARFFAPAARDGHAMFDLAGYIASRLQDAGVGRIEDLGHCTYAEAARFFSYRRSTHRAEADYGRHVNAIALAE